LIHTCDATIHGPGARLRNSGEEGGEFADSKRKEKSCTNQIQWVRVGHLSKTYVAEWFAEVIWCSFVALGDGGWGLENRNGNTKLSQELK